MSPNGAFHSILFPVDFSAASVASARHVRALAEQTGAHVSLLHVIPWLSAWYSATELKPSVAGDALLQHLEQEAAGALDKFSQTHLVGVSVTSEVKSGAVAETITATAADRDCDLIMMPTRGLGRSRPFLIGSTTAKVLHDAVCAVWTSPHMDQAPPPPLTCSHIMCSLDRNHIPLGYIDQAIRLASCFGAKLTLVTAVPSCVGGCGDQHRVRSLTEEFPQANLDNIPMPSDCVVLVETGPVGDVIRKCAEEHKADLVLANRGHIHEPFGRFRTHSYEIVLSSPCPVISLCIYSGAEKNQTDRTARPERLQSAVV